MRKFWWNLPLIPFLGFGLSCSHPSNESNPLTPSPGSKVAERFRVFVPPGEKTSYPLLVMIHGCAQNAETFERGSLMDEEAQRNGFLVLYPDQKKGRNIYNCWNWFDPENRKPNGGELKEILDMVESVAAKYPIDRSKIYLAGLSSGAATAAALLACHPSQFAGAILSSGPALNVADNAFAAMTVMRFGPSYFLASAEEVCKPDLTNKRLVIVQGTSDTTVNPRHADKLVSQFVPPDAKSALVELKLSAMGERKLNSREYTSERGDVLVIKVEEMEHAWAGGKEGEKYFDPKAFSASELTARYLMGREKPF